MKIKVKFTIHFATINTMKTKRYVEMKQHLQYTLLLLILDQFCSPYSCFHHLQYTLLLLIL